MTSQKKTTLAINGFGRIGRTVLRSFLESEQYRQQFEVLAINELADHATLAHLLKYDSTHGKLSADVSLHDGKLIIEGQYGSHSIQLCSEKNIPELDWQGVDILLECSGSFTDKARAQQHLDQGAAKLLFSQPAQADVDATVVYGVNDGQLLAEHKIISNASCTTNAITPVIKVIQESLGIQAGTITTLHSAMNDQPVIDAYHHTDLRKTRAAISSMIPVNTELAKGIERILPNMADKFTAHAIRVPTLNVSAIDLTLQLESDTTAEQINQLLQASTAQVKQVMAVTYEPLASCDFNHDSHSVIVDASQTQVVQGRLVKLLLWFDNEWGFANRMLDVAALL